MTEELEKVVKEADEDLMRRWSETKLPWIGITRWSYIKWFFIFGIVSVILLPILFFLVYFT